MKSLQLKNCQLKICSKKIISKNEHFGRLRKIRKYKDKKDWKSN